MVTADLDRRRLELASSPNYILIDGNISARVLRVVHGLSPGVSMFAARGPIVMLRRRGVRVLVFATPSRFRSASAEHWHLLDSVPFWETRVLVWRSLAESRPGAFVIHLHRLDGCCRGKWRRSGTPGRDRILVWRCFTVPEPASGNGGQLNSRLPGFNRSHSQHVGWGWTHWYRTLH
jgi:hypothetical protein